MRRVSPATQPLVKQQEQVREVVTPLLEGALKVNLRAWREALTSESLLGRYLEEFGANGGTGDRS